MPRTRCVPVREGTKKDSQGAVATHPAPYRSWFSHVSSHVALRLPKLTRDLSGCPNPHVGRAARG